MSLGIKSGHELGIQDTIYESLIYLNELYAGINQSKICLRDVQYFIHTQINVIRI